MKDLYLELLKEELVPALGCTEPIAIAYASAKAKEILGEFPEKITAICSGNIIKNVKGVIVPTTTDMKGIETSAILGAVGGNPNKELQVLSDVLESDVLKTKELLKENFCDVLLKEGVENLYIEIVMTKEENSSSVTISNSHTNIIEMKKNNEVIFKNEDVEENTNKIDRNFITIKGIYDYITTCDTNTLKDLLDIQIKYNTEISEEGLNNNYGTNVGKTLIKAYGNRVENLAKAYAASGSDARMSGSILPVVINSGSGNQGLTVSMPVIVYAKDLKVSDEMLYRALALSNLVAIHIKTEIGKLSAFCGAVSASCGSGAAIAYLKGESYDVITKTIINTLGTTSGIVCDGAKPSCAAKIASSVDASIMAYYMAKEDNVFSPGEGLIKDDVEETVKSICKMAREGMKETDIEILNIMINKG
ncbi:MAG: L-serine ammonia-lyase, iron-sulfur-dependent, subunit alpha [Peptostreptococcaceae bacterium]